MRWRCAGDRYTGCFRGCPEFSIRVVRVPVPVPDPGFVYGHGHGHAYE
jgi:hypothetical protein